MYFCGEIRKIFTWYAIKLNVVAQKRPCRSKKTWDEVLMNNRKKLGMDSADPQNRSK